MTRTRFGLPPWLIGSVVLIGSGALFLLASNEVLPSMSHSWPLLIALAGLAVLLFDARSYLAFAGILMAIGLMIFLHNEGTLDLRRDWAWLLIVIGLLVAVDRLFVGRDRAGPES